MYVLHLPALAQSVYFRPHLIPLAGGSLLQRFIEAFTTQFGDLLVLHYGPPDAPALAAAASGRNVRLVESAAITPLAALGQLAERYPGVDMLVFSMEASLVPSGIFASALEYHQREGNSYTPIVGLPEGARMEVFAADLLAQAAKAFAGTRIVDPAAAIAAISLGITGNSFDFRLKTSAYQALEHDSGLPSQIDLSAWTAPQAAATVVSRHGVLPPDTAALRAWKAAIVERRGRRAPLLDCTPAKTHAYRCLYVSNASALTGAEQALIDLVSAADPAWDQWALIAYDGKFAEQMRASGCRVILARAEIASASAETVRLLTALVEMLRPDIIHLNAYSGLPIVVAAERCGVPVVQHVRIANPAELGEALLRADGIIAVSAFVRDRICELNVDASRIAVIPDGVDTDFLDPTAIDAAEVRRRLGLPVTAVIVLSAARFAPQKRLDLLVEAAANLRGRNPELVFVLAGEWRFPESTFEQLASAIRKNELEDTVRLLPFQNDRRSLLAACDIYILCSENESLGMSTLEAMSLAKANIVTNSGGLKEFVRDGETALLIEPDAGSVTSAIERVSRDAGLRLNIGRNARAYVTAHLNKQQCAKRTFEYFWQLAQSYSTPPAAAGR